MLQDIGGILSRVAGEFAVMWGINWRSVAGVVGRQPLDVGGFSRGSSAAQHS